MCKAKEKSAVDSGISATDKEKNYTTSINHSSTKIKCVVQNPGEISNIEEIFNCEWEICKIIEGTPATMAIGNGRLIVYNKYGFDYCMNPLKPNICLDDGLVISGTVIIMNGDKYNRNFTNEQIQSARKWLLKHMIMEE